MICRLVIFVSLLMMARTSYAQPTKIHFKHIGNENGLSNSTVETLFQDKRGFIWIGTRDGLNRYDGHQVIVYKHQAGDSNSICDNYINAIAEDAHQQLWIGTMNGISRFTPALNKFLHFKLSHNHISAILVDQRQRKWAASFGGGIFHFDENSQTWKEIPSFRSNGSSRETHLYILYEDSKQNLWAGGDSGLFLYNEARQCFEQVTEVSLANTSNLTLKDITEDKSGNLLLATENSGLLVYNAQFRQLQQFAHHPLQPNSISSNMVRSLLVTKNGDVWTGTVNGGLDYFEPHKLHFYNYQYQPENPGSLSQRTVSALLEDVQGNIWIGTHRGGVNLYMPGAQKFKLFRQQPDKNSLSYNDVKAFCEDKQGNIWIGTDGGGLNKFNKQTQSFQHFKFDPFLKNSLGSNEVISITEDSDGKLWVGTWGGGLCLLNSNGKDFTRFQGPAYIQKVFEDSKGQIWVATYYDGLHQFDKNTGKFFRINRSSSGKTRIIGNNIISIAEDPSGNLWFGTDDGGLNRLDAVTSEYTQYFNQEEKNPDIRVLMIDNKGDVWVGQSGLYKLNKQQNKFLKVAADSELSNLFIKGIVEDNHGYFWISSSDGIIRLNPATSEFRKYNIVDGLQGPEFEAGAYLRTRDGEVYFGGINGFNCFYPNEISNNNFIPPVYLTEFAIGKHSIHGNPLQPNLKKDISVAETIHLSWKEATFSIGFTALNFTSAENNQYVYKLEGWDRDWINAGAERKVTYTNVSPGTYTFYVKASNNDGLWNEEGRQITVIIKPPFYQTWWFKLLVIAIIATAVYYFIQFKKRIQLERFRESQRQQMHEMQLQFFTNISHEFRTPLSLIIGPAEKLVKDHPDSPLFSSFQVIQRNAHRLLQLINELMDFRKAESGALKLQVMRGSVPHFIDEIAQEFSEIAVRKNIKFIINTENLPKETWFDRQVLEKIIINLLSNSFKYTTPNGEIHLETFTKLQHFKPSFENELKFEFNSNQSEFLYFRVADNGVGISKESIKHLFERYYRVSDAHMGSGIGLAFVKTLTQLHKGNIWVYSQRNKGTELIIGIPVGQSAYTQEEKWTPVPQQQTSLQSLQDNRVNGLHADSFNTEVRSIPDNLQKLPIILLADDHEELRGFLKESLEGEFTVAEANNGEVALNFAKEYYPDIVISDIMMPVMDGIRFCTELKNNPDISHIPFILLTAKTSMESQLEGAGSGADFYFSKPINTELLLQTVRNILHQKQKLRERYRRDQHAEVRELAHHQRDQEFLDQLIGIIDKNLNSLELDIDFLCTQVGMSRTKLYHKVKSITGQSIGDFIRSMRLKKAAQLMSETDSSLADIMYAVGIQTQSYFSKAFKAEFGKTPTQFLKELEAGDSKKES